MDLTTALWLFGVVFACLVGLGGLIWRHVEHCKDVHAMLAEVRSDVKRLVVDVGTHETGLRGHVHKLANAQLIMDGRVSLLEERERR